MAHHPESGRLANAIERCLAYAVTWAGDVYRSTSPKYASRDDLVTGAGARANGGRWNPPGIFPAVYACLEPETAMAEALAHFRRFQFPLTAAMPRVFAAIKVQLNRLLDLRLGAVRKIVRVSARRIRMEEWWTKQELGEEALTQAMGRLGWEARWEGLLVPSAALAGGANLVVFPENLDPSSRLEILNPAALPPRL